MKTIINVIKDKKIIIFGTGNLAEMISKYLPFNIEFYVDNNKNKWGQYFHERLIKNPDV